MNPIVFCFRLVNIFQSIFIFLENSNFLEVNVVKFFKESRLDLYCLVT